MYTSFRKLVWIFSSSATFMRVLQYFHYPQCWKSALHKTFKLVPRLLKLWPCAQADIFTKDQVTLQMLPLFWKMPLAVASSQEAAEFSQAQLVRCGWGFWPTHIRVQYLASGSVSDTHGENGQGKSRERGEYGKLDSFLYCIKRLLLKCSERWSERADILNPAAALVCLPCFVNEQCANWDHKFSFNIKTWMWNW